jgi:hypothetical protein
VNRELDSVFPIAALETVLNGGDDPALWRAVLSIVMDDFAQRHVRESKSANWGMVVGTCSHWLWPHKGRWTKAGGFAYPEGYKNYRPELEWSLILQFRGGQWVPVVRLPRQRSIIITVVIPSRTKRHKQAAIYTRWQPANEIILYGFRKHDGEWLCVAASDEDTGGHVLRKN